MNSALSFLELPSHVFELEDHEDEDGDSDSEDEIEEVGEQMEEDE